MARENEERESIWGIDSKDRRWFQALTLAGGTVASVSAVFLEISYRTSDITPNTLTQNILLSIGASFIAAGFVSWSLLQAKELVMAIADWIRERTAKQRAKFAAEIYAKGYSLGYEDRDKGKARRFPADASDKPSKNGKSD